MFTFSKMTGLMREVEQEHAKVEKTLPKHDWQDWYGAYLAIRMSGEWATQADASDIASSWATEKASKRGLNPPVPATTDDFQAPPPFVVVHPDAKPSEDVLGYKARQAGYTTLQGLCGIAGLVLTILALIVLATPAG